jgi:putative membrane protein
MLLAAKILTALILLLHVYIVLIETVLFKSRGKKVFGVPDALVPAISPLMSNQGCYNGFLVAALALGLANFPNPGTGFAFVVYGLVCVAVAGVWGAVTAKPQILFIQTVPAVIALALWFLS